MTSATAKKPAIDTTAALRHAVYADLLSMLPIASYRQVQRFAANLALCRNTFDLWEHDFRKRQRAIDRVLLRLLLLRVTPDLAEVKLPTLDRRDIELAIEKRFGDRLSAIAGFYRDPNNGRWRVNLPEGCALYGYRSREGFFTGILCQPIDRDDFYFLLSSSKFDGPKAMRLTDSDRAFFERFKEPVELPPAAQAIRDSIPPLDMTGFRFNGRRFVEVKQ